MVYKKHLTVQNYKILIYLNILLYFKTLFNNKNSNKKDLQYLTPYKFQIINDGR